MAPPNCTAVAKVPEARPALSKRGCAKRLKTLARPTVRMSPPGTAEVANAASALPSAAKLSARSSGG